MIKRVKKTALKHKKAVIAAGIILALAAFLLARRHGSEGIEVAVKKGSIIDAVYGIGTVTAHKTYQLKVGVTTNISRLSVDEGQYVHPGEPLLSLEGMPTFRAPFAGTVTSLPYKISESVFPQTPILTLVDLKDRYLVVSLEQQTVIRVKKGQPASLSFESMRDQTFQGRVRTIFSNDGQFIVHIDVDTLPSQILPGMTADVAIQIDKRDGVIVIPVAALSASQVTRIRGRSRQEIPVKTGVIDGDSAEVVSGDLTEGDGVFIRTKGK